MTRAELKAENDSLRAELLDTLGALKLWADIARKQLECISHHVAANKRLTEALLKVDQALDPKSEAHGELPLFTHRVTLRSGPAAEPTRCKIIIPHSAIAEITRALRETAGRPQLVSASDIIAF